MTDKSRGIIAADGAAANARVRGLSRCFRSWATPPWLLARGQRWIVVRWREFTYRRLSGWMAMALSRRLVFDLFRLEDWCDQALSGIDGALQARPGDSLDA